jgi:hypothetical protein
VCVLEGFSFFIILAKLYQYILAPVESKAVMGQKHANNKWHSFLTYSQLNHRNPDFQNSVKLFRMLNLL